MIHLKKAGLLCVFIIASSVSAKSPKIEKEYEQLEVFTKAMFYLESLYVDEKKIDREKLIQNALKGMVSGLDPHTIFFPKTAFNKFTTDTSGKFGGIGIIVSHERHKLIIVSAIEDTPAFKAGIKTGDEIVKVNGKKIIDFKGQDPLTLLKGTIGSTVTLEIKRKKSKKNLVFKLRRELIKVKSVKKYDLGDSFASIRISSFQEETSTELASIVRQAQGKSGIVLDMRGNPGGLLDKAVEVVDLFIESGIIVSTIGRDKNKVEREFAKKRGTYSNIPIVVLLDRGSASASEVVAGALQDYKRAFVVGAQSFGKGSVQTLISLPDGSGIKMTVAKYYTPLNRSIHGVGIKPDKEISIELGATKAGGKKPSASVASAVGKKIGITADDTISSWPENLQKDPQLIAAYLYLKEWFKYHKKGQKAVVPKKFY